jgi:hypothetical protein
MDAATRQEGILSGNLASFMKEVSSLSRQPARWAAPGQGAASLAARRAEPYHYLMPLPEYPRFAPIDTSMLPDLYPMLNMIRDGISELTFSNLYLFRHVYGYEVSKFSDGGLAIRGAKEGKSFFYIPCCLPEPAVFDELMAGHDYFKNMSESQAQRHRIDLENRGYLVTEDRDNFDYLYNRKDLAELTGKEYHKKRNLVNAFLNSYTYEQRPLKSDNVADAIAVLDEWRASKGVEGDYRAAREGLEGFKELGMRGAVFYVEGIPAGWCMGESIARGTMFAIHFEKACDRFKGIYQFINQAFAQSLPEHYKLVNREQDLGHEGMRQAKMTYRPCGFVKKYRVTRGAEPVGGTGFAEPAPSGPGTGHDA